MEGMASNLCYKRIDTREARDWPHGWLAVPPLKRRRHPEA